MPYIFSISVIILGGKPLAPRYLLFKLEDASNACLFLFSPIVSPVPEPAKRAVASTASPDNWAIICSTGPPGTI